MKKMSFALLLFVLFALPLSGCDAEKPYVAGSWDGDVYSSTFLGFRYTLPGDWVAATEEELADMEQQAEAALQQARSSDNPSAVQTHFYALSAKSADESLGLIILTQRQDYAVKDYIKALQAGAEAEDANYTLGEMADKTLGDHTYTMIPVTVQGQANIQRQYVRTDGDFLVNIMAFAPDDDAFADIEAAFSPTNG